MKVAGIIAEYNPFHKGHLYQIEEIRKKLGQDTFIVIAMSGSFTQRGEPSVSDKWTRTETALSLGADLVIEIPFTFACAPSDRFSRGAVKLLSSLGIITHLAFGAETEDLNLLLQIAKKTKLPHPETEELLKKELRAGLSFAAARQSAVMKILSRSEAPEFLSGISTLLSSPNTILALSYLQALEDIHSTIHPLLIPRIGAGYLDCSDTNTIMSATGLRKIVKESSCFSDRASFYNTIQNLAGRLPGETLAKLALSWQNGMSPVFMENLAFDIVHTLSVRNRQDLAGIAYMTDNLGSRLKNAVEGLRLSDKKSLFDVFSARAYTKRYANTRVNRAMISLLMGQTTNDLISLPEPLYIRILGFSKDGQYLLRRMKEFTRLPVVTKSSDFREHGTNISLSRMAELDLISTEYLNQKTGLPFGDEFNRKVVVYKGKKRKPKNKIAINDDHPLQT